MIIIPYNFLQLMNTKIWCKSMLNITANNKIFVVRSRIHCLCLYFAPINRKIIHDKFFVFRLRHSRRLKSECITYVMVDLICSHFASLNASVPSPFPCKIYRDIIKTIVLEPYVTVDLSAERCITCRLQALASVDWCIMHFPSTVT
jgi:hypothetical protein